MGSGDRPRVEVATLISEAVASFQQGRLAEARGFLEKILEKLPNHAEANHLLGLVAGRQGKLQLARKFFTRAITFNPSQPRYYNNLGIALSGAGCLDEALRAYDQAIRLAPDQAEAHNLRGNVLVELHRIEEALESYERAITCMPGFADAQSNRGMALWSLGRNEDALAAIDNAITLNPGLVQAHNLRGNVLSSFGRQEESLAAYEQAIQLDPDYVEAHNNRAITLWKLGRLDDARRACDKALSLQPASAEAHNLRGVVLNELGQPDVALQACEQAIGLKQDYADAHRNRAVILQNLGDHAAALEACRTAIRLRPDDAEAHYNYGMLLLMVGDFRNGWRECEWRAVTGRKFHSGERRSILRWQGDMLEGKTLLVHAEQGLGDTIQFIRYIPQLKTLGGHVVVECQKPLVRLLSQIPGVDLFVESGGILPEIDFQVPLLSLPHVFGTTLDTVPDRVPYLEAEPLMNGVSRQLDINGGKRNIGIVWVGSPVHRNDRNRSVDLSYFRPLLDIPGIRWFSLQYGDRVADLDKAEGFDAVRNTSDFIADFSDTAAIIDKLDLIISVDTAVAHLAGALGKPVWLLLPFAPDWRWLLGREDSPWYPHMRLFRQTVRGAWEDVFDAVYAALIEDYRA